MPLFDDVPCFVAIPHITIEPGLGTVTVGHVEDLKKFSLAAKVAIGFELSTPLKSYDPHAPVSPPLAIHSMDGPIPA